MLFIKSQNGFWSVIGTFAIYILFNIMVPTGDVGTDILTMFSTLSFDLGNSLELSGCKLYYHKSAEEVFYQVNYSSDNDCKTCTFNPVLYCGVFPSFLDKMKESENEKYACSHNEPMRVTKNLRLEIGECDEMHDLCCSTKSKDIKENPIPKLDPTKLFMACVSLTQELKEYSYCNVIGTYISYGYQCLQFELTDEFQKLFAKRAIDVITSSRNETILILT